MFPFFAYKANFMGIEEAIQFKFEESVQCLHEGITWMEERVNEMDIAGKDVVVVVGPSRTGKGTLLTAL